MVMSEIVSYWMEMSDYDFDTAVAMQKTGRYLYVGFMCHQSVEKILKAYYNASTNETPPYIHSLSRLAEKSGLLIELSEEHLDVIDELEPLNIESRYPSYKEMLMKSLNEDKCKQLLVNTKSLISWIKKKL